jgi:hypothetical protein
VARWQVIDPPASYGAATTTIVQGTRRPLFLGKLHSEDDVKVTGAKGGEHCFWARSSPTWQEP